jgi:hypothetical protein
MSTTAKRLRLAAVALFVYTAVLVTFWAARPLHDLVPVGIDRTPTTAVPPQPEQAISQSVKCNTLFASAPRPDESLPKLRPQPKGQPALAYQRDPCPRVHSEARLVFAIDTVVVLALAGLIAFRAARLRRPNVAQTIP